MGQTINKRLTHLIFRQSQSWPKTVIAVQSGPDLSIVFRSTILLPHASHIVGTHKKGKKIEERKTERERKVNILRTGSQIQIMLDRFSKFE